VPIEQLFKRVRLEVNHSTSGQQTPWESSSLTSDFYFFGNTAVAANRPPVKAPVVQMASNLPSRSARQAYDYVLSEGNPEYYQEFIQMYPHDPLCDHIRWLLGNLLMADAWHKTVLANSPLAYKTFYESYSSSPYAQSALKLQMQPKQIPLMQATHFLAPQTIAPTLKLGNLGPTRYIPLIQQGNGGALNKPIPIDSNVIGKPSNGGQIVTRLANNQPNNAPSQIPGKIVTLPAPTKNTTNSGTVGRIVTLPVTTVGRGGSNVDVKNIDVKTTNVQTQNQPIRTGKGNTGVVKLNNNPTNNIQVRTNRTQPNTVPSRTVGGAMNGNFKPRFAQTMNQAPMNAGMNRRGGFMH
jgi:hypothetical protein